MFFDTVSCQLGSVLLSVANLIADLGVEFDPGHWPHAFVEIDHEIFSSVILILLLIQEGLLSNTSKSTCSEYGLTAWSICLFGLLLNIPVNSYDHVRMVSSPNHTFCLGKLA